MEEDGGEDDAEEAAPPAAPPPLARQLQHLALCSSGSGRGHVSKIDLQIDYIKNVNIYFHRNTIYKIV